MLTTTEPPRKGRIADANCRRNYFASRRWKTELVAHHRKSLKTALYQRILCTKSRCSASRSAQQKKQPQHCKRPLWTTKLRTARSTAGGAHYILQQSGTAETNVGSSFSCLLCAVRQNWKIHRNGELLLLPKTSKLLIFSF